MAKLSDKRECANIEFDDVSFPMPWGHVVGRWYGSRNIRPILALHGWLDNLGTWNTLLPLLPKHIGVLCIDLPGHGHSSKLPIGVNYSAFDYVFIILRIIKEYDWPKVSLLTHSMSSMISFVFSALCPQLVDMLISIDVVYLRCRKPPIYIELLRKKIERNIIENERLDNPLLLDPPSHTFKQLESILHEGSLKSLELANCKHLLERNVDKSEMYPKKYFFSRDARVKFYFEPTITLPFAVALAQRLKTVPYCVIKASESKFINEGSNDVIELLHRQNPFFEFHEIPGTHHVHLNDPAKVAAIINPFINRHRPPLLESWSVNGDGAQLTKKETIMKADQIFSQTCQRSKL